MQAIILSGGLGTRLHPLTLDTPKPMLPINGIPLLEYQIRLLKKYGVEDIIFSTGYLHHKIEDYFGNGNKLGVKIQYKEDGEVALGTAGAVKNCEDLIVSDSFLVLNGDILTNINVGRLIEVHNQYKQPITLTAIEVLDATGFGLLDIDKRSGKILDFIEKPEENRYAGPVNAGIYAIRKDVLNSIRDGFSMFEQDIFPYFVEARMVQSFYCLDDNLWLDIGTHVRYNEAQEVSKKIIL